MKVPKRSPWGPVQDAKEIADGILSIGTASHGGFKLSPKLNKMMPPSARRKGGWYEEDVEWALVALMFPDAFSKRHVEAAHHKAKNWLPMEYTAITGKQVSIDESQVLQIEKARYESRNKFVTRAAWGDWAEGVPKGMVKVLARKEATGEEAEFLIPQAEYRSRIPGFGFIVDERKHKRVSKRSKKRKNPKGTKRTKNVSNVRSLVARAMK